MAKHLQRDLDDLKRQLLGVGGLVEQSIDDALRAYIHGELDRIERVIERDDVIDAHELEVEDECLKILALHQPMAADLRFVVAVLKVNNDLERMGDLAVTIAKRSRAREKPPEQAAFLDFADMSSAVIKMVRGSLDSLVNLDPDEARQICAADQKVDDINKANFKLLRQKMAESPENVDQAVSGMSVSRSLERIADLATNIAEDVVFLVEGDIIRHGRGLEPD